MKSKTRLPLDEPKKRLTRKANQMNHSDDRLYYCCMSFQWLMFNWTLLLIVLLLLYFSNKSFYIVCTENSHYHYFIRIFFWPKPIIQYVSPWLDKCDVILCRQFYGEKNKSAMMTMSHVFDQICVTHSHKVSLKAERYDTMNVLKFIVCSSGNKIISLSSSVYFLSNLQ